MVYLLAGELDAVAALPPAALLLVRALAALMTALVVALAFGGWFIRFQLRRAALERAAKGDSERLDELHGHKRHTPTMGGWIFLVGLGVSTLLWARLDDRLVWLLLAVALAFAVLGFADDWVKLRVKGRNGISARVKFAVQVAIGAACGAYLLWRPAASDAAVATALLLPFGGGVAVPLGGLAFVALSALVISGSSNAVNLTDGLDGLAMGCAVLAGIPLAVVALLAAQPPEPGRTEIPHVPGGSEVALVLLALLGGGLGFLWFNRHPARVFMGDTGALPLGALLGLVAVMLRQELLLVVAGGVFVVEALSVILQVGSFKLRGKRIFLIAPLHHHFQFKGWSESKVTARFWLASALLSVAALLALLREAISAQPSAVGF